MNNKNLKDYKSVFFRFFAKNLINPTSALSKDILTLLTQQALLKMSQEERNEFMQSIESNPNLLFEIIDSKITDEDKRIVSNAINLKLSQALINTAISK